MIGSADYDTDRAAQILSSYMYAAWRIELRENSKDSHQHQHACRTHSLVDHSHCRQQEEFTNIITYLGRSEVSIAKASFIRYIFS